MLQSVLRLAVYLDRSEFRNKAERILYAFGNKPMDSPIVFSQMILKLEYRTTQVRASDSPIANDRVIARLYMLAAYFSEFFFFPDLSSREANVEETIEILNYPRMSIRQQDSALFRNNLVVGKRKL